MAMRISKWPTIMGIGRDSHQVLPPSAPPVPPNPAPIPALLWTSTLINPLSALIFGKYTVTTVTEANYDILMGHDWGLPQFHLPTPPALATPSLGLLCLGDSHKFFLPSYAVQETPGGGALAMAGPAGSAVAISTSVFVIIVQDCMDVSGIGFVAPTGASFQPVSTRWVGFNWTDLAAGMISLAGDAACAALGSAIGNLFGLGPLSGAVMGALTNTANAAIQNLMNNNSNAIPGVVAAAGCTGPGALLVLPAFLGLGVGKLADSVGGAERPTDTGT